MSRQNSERSWPALRAPGKGPGMANTNTRTSVKPCVAWFLLNYVFAKSVKRDSPIARNARTQFDDRARSTVLIFQERKERENTGVWRAIYAEKIQSQGIMSTIRKFHSEFIERAKIYHLVTFWNIKSVLRGDGCSRWSTIAAADADESIE